MTLNKLSIAQLIQLHERFGLRYICSLDSRMRQRCGYLFMLTGQELKNRAAPNAGGSHG